MSYVKGVALFAAGVAVGAGGVFLWLRKDYEKKVMEAEEQIRNADKKEPKTVQSEKEIKNEAGKKEEDLVRNAYFKTTEALGYSPSERDEGEAALVRESRDDILEQKQSHEYPREDEFEGPVLCSEGEMLHANDGFTKHTLIWYMRDDLLTTEEGEVLEDPYYILGDKWKEAVGIEEEYKGYIKNDKVGAYYEIFAEDDSYALTHIDE